MTKDALIAFEADIAARFNAGTIRAPIHLYSGVEDQMIEVFRDIRPQDPGPDCASVPISLAPHRWAQQRACRSHGQL